MARPGPRAQAPVGLGVKAGRGPTGTDLIGLGGMLAAALIGPMAVGWGVDSATHRGPLFLLIGLGVGILAAIAVAYTRFKRFL